MYMSPVMAAVKAPEVAPAPSTSDEIRYERGMSSRFSIRLQLVVIALHRDSDRLAGQLALRGGARRPGAGQLSTAAPARDGRFRSEVGNFPGRDAGLQSSRGHSVEEPGLIGRRREPGSERARRRPGAGQLLGLIFEFEELDATGVVLAPRRVDLGADPGQLRGLRLEYDEPAGGRDEHQSQGAENLGRTDGLPVHRQPPDSGTPMPAYRLL
jgi:hypothetical protein